MSHRKTQLYHRGVCSFLSRRAKISISTNRESETDFHHFVNNSKKFVSSIHTKRTELIDDFLNSREHIDCASLCLLKPDRTLFYLILHARPWIFRCSQENTQIKHINIYVSLIIRSGRGEKKKLRGEEEKEICFSSVKTSVYFRDNDNIRGSPYVICKLRDNDFSTFPQISKQNNEWNRVLRRVTTCDHNIFDATIIHVFQRILHEHIFLCRV